MTLAQGCLWLLSVCRAGGARSLLCPLQSMAPLSEAAQAAGRHGRDAQSLGQVLADASRTSRALMVQPWPGGSRGSVGGAVCRALLEELCAPSGLALQQGSWLWKREAFLQPEGLH